MSAKSESCPVCGWSLNALTQHICQPSDKSNGFISDYAHHLQSVFEENLTLQKEQPQYDYLFAFEDEQFENEGGTILVLDRYQRILSNRPQLDIQFTFNNEEVSRFRNLNISSAFEVDYDPNGDSYVLCHLKDDAKEAAMLVEKVFTHVYKLEKLPTLYNNKVVYPHRDKDYLKFFFQKHIPMTFCFDLPQSSNMAKIKSLYEDASKALKRWRFGEIEFNEEERCIKGSYQPEEEPSGFFASIKHGGKLEDCEASLIRLLSQCYESFK